MTPPSPITLALHRILLRSSRTPLRRLWIVGYWLIARLWGAYLAGGSRRVATYVRGSFTSPDLLPGLSDVDVVVVLPDEPGRPGVAAARARERWQRLRRVMPFTGLVLDYPRIYEESELRDVTGRSALTYGLEPPDDRRAAYLGAGSSPDCIRTLERPGLYGQTGDWRRMSGPDRRPAEAARDAQHRRVAAWLELEYWWRWAFPVCIDASGPRTARLCVRLIAEPARIWLWLAHGERAGDRPDTLRRALHRMPEEEGSLRQALELHASLADSPAAPLGEVLRALIRLSARIAALVAAEVEDQGTTPVRLVGGDLILPRATWHPPGGPNGDADPGVLPLCDWRSLVWPRRPDPAFAPLAGDPGDPAVLAAAAVHDAGPYPALSARSLLIRPAAVWHRARLRALQCPVTDPVSFALMRGDAVAGFSNADGWSAQDTARRAIAEHRAWLAAAPPDPTGPAAFDALGVLLTAARAAMFSESIANGDPELALTVTAAAHRLAARSPSCEAVATEALEAYRQAVLGPSAPPIATISALHRLVRSLPAYAQA